MAALMFVFFVFHSPGSLAETIARPAGPPVATATTTLSAFDTAGVQNLFGSGTIPRMNHADAKYAKGSNRQCRAAWAQLKSRKPAKAEVKPAAVEKLRQAAVSQGINEKFLKKSIATFLANQAELPNQRYVTFIDFNQRSNQKRMVIMDLTNATLKTYAVAAGKNSDPAGNGYATRFSNTHGSLQSSLGCYVANGEFTDGKGRRSLLIHGFEPTNDNACERAVYMHPATYAGGIPGRSFGCPAVRPQDRAEVYKQVGAGGLICAYSDKASQGSGPAPQPRKKGRGR